MTVNRPVLGLRWRAARWVAPAVMLLASLLAPSAAALEIIDSSGGVIYVEVNKGRLLRLDQVPATVFLADHNLAVEQHPLLLVEREQRGFARRLANHIDQL